MNQPGWEALAHESFDRAHVHLHVRCALAAATKAHHIFGHRFPRAEALQAVGAEERAPLGAFSRKGQQAVAAEQEALAAQRRRAVICVNVMCTTTLGWY